MKGKSPLFDSKIKSASGNISFMPEKGQKSLFAKFIANRHDVDPNGQFDVIAHGSWKEIEVNTSRGIIRINARQAAKLIRRQPGFKKAKAVRFYPVVLVLTQKDLYSI